MALYEREKKILVVAGNNNPDNTGSINCLWWSKCYCPLYLHTFLKQDGMKKDTSKSTVLVICTGFLILYLLFAWQWALIVSLVVGLAAIISGTLSRLIEKGWMGLAKILSYIIPSILLGIVFYLILFPISLISKIFTKDPLMLSPKYNSYFVTVSKESDKENLEKIW